jgi:hypothetical protein
MVLAEVPFPRLKEALHRIEESPEDVTLGVKRGEELLQIKVPAEPSKKK